MGGNSSAGVAIIGIACRFPGAADPSAFWRNLCEGVESITALSDDELLSAGVPSELLRSPSYVKAASLLPDIDQFDAAFFEYSPEEARLMDPQQRLLLEVAWEAFEDAGQPPGGAAKPIGVFTGLGGVVSSYLVDRLPLSADLPGYTGTLTHLGNDKDFASTRISYKLNLTGPSINVQTACSTSLVAVHLACQAILAGECDMALAGAASVRVPQRIGYTSVKGGILSPDGHCRAFDAGAQGTIFGSGVGAILLKDLAAAVADGNQIYAVIRGSAINNDGADKVSYTASSAAGQARAMVEALLMADASPDDIAYVECHGTGTAVGDPLEIDALTRAFRTGTERRGFCAIGSVKTNIGHLEQTAGLAALIKTALALKHGKIPPSLNFRNPNPKIDFAASPFVVNTVCRDWPAGERSRFAAVNSLGSRWDERFHRARRSAGGNRDGGRAGAGPVHALGKDRSRVACFDRTPPRVARGRSNAVARPLLDQHKRPSAFSRAVYGRRGFERTIARRTRGGSRRRRRAATDRRSPARLSVLRAGVAIRGNGRGALSPSARLPRGSRPLRRDHGQAFGAAAQGRAPVPARGYEPDR